MPKETQPLKWALWITMVIIVYLTLYPFDFSPQMERFFDFGPPSLTDMVSNIFLFLPFGFFLGAILPSRSLLWKSTLVVVSALVFSGLIEMLQCHLPRNPSLADIIFNVLGAFVGLLFSPFAHRLFNHSKQESLFLLATALLYLRPFDLGFNWAKVEAFFKNFHALNKVHLHGENLALPAFVLALWGEQTKKDSKLLLLYWFIFEGIRLFFLRSPNSPLEGLLRGGLMIVFFELLSRFPRSSLVLFGLAYLSSVLPPLRLSPLLPRLEGKFSFLFPTHVSLATTLQILSICSLFALWPFLKPRWGLKGVILFISFCLLIRLLFSQSLPTVADFFLAPLGAWIGTKLFDMRPSYDLSGSS